MFNFYLGGNPNFKDKLWKFEFGREKFKSRKFVENDEPSTWIFIEHSQRSITTPPQRGKNHTTVHSSKQTTKNPSSKIDEKNSKKYTHVSIILIFRNIESSTRENQAAIK